MTISHRKGLRALGFLTLIMAACTWAVPQPLRFWTMAMVVLAGIESAVAFSLLCMTLHRSNEAFYSAFIGGIFGRLILLSVVAAVLYRWAPSIAFPLLTLIGAFFISSLVQLPYLIRNT